MSSDKFSQQQLLVFCEIHLPYTMLTDETFKNSKSYKLGICLFFLNNISGSI